MKLVQYKQGPTQVATPTAFLHSLQEVREFAEIVLQSEMFKDVKSAAQAVVKIARGRELGLGPMESLSSLHVVEGKVTMSAQLMAALAQRAGFRYKVTELTDQICRLMWYDAEGDQLGPSEFTMHDAHRAGLARRQNWRKDPKAMLQARALAAGARLYAAAALLGVYDPDELAPDPVEPDTHTPVTVSNPTPPHDTKAPRVVEATLLEKNDTHTTQTAQTPSPSTTTTQPKAEKAPSPSPFQQAAQTAQTTQTVASSQDDAYHPGAQWNEANQRIRTVASSQHISIEELRLVIRNVYESESSVALHAKDLHAIADVLEDGPDDRHHAWLSFATNIMSKAQYTDEIIEQAYVEARSKIWYTILLHRHIKNRQS
jgi:hypothetical protein